MTRLRRSLLSSFASNYAGLALNIVTTVIVARLITPAETGLFSIAAGVINILQAVRECGTGAYIVQERDLTRAKLATAVTLSAGLGLLLMLLFLLAAPWIGAAFAAPRLTLVMRLVSVNFLLVGLSGTAMALLQRDMRFDLIFWISLAQNCLHSGLTVLLAAAGYGALSMAWATVLANLTTLAGCALVLRRQLLLRPSLANGAAILRFGSFAAAGSLIASACLRLPDIVIGRLLGFEMAGLFSRGNGLITLFEQAVMAAVTPVATSAFAEVRRDGADLAAPFLHTLRLLSAVAWPALAMMAMLALPIIRLAFGPAWLPSVPVAQIMCLAAGFTVLTTVTTALLTGHGAVRRFFLQQAVSLPLLLAALVGGSRFGLAGAAWGVTLWSALLAALALGQAASLLRLAPRRLLAPLGNGLAALSASQALPLLLAPWLAITPTRMIVPALLRGLAALAGWLVFLHVTRHPLAAELRRLVGLGAEARG